MPRLTEAAQGVFVIAPTPFTESGALDLESTDRMTDAYLAAGAAGLTILGIMGEAPKLDAAESLAFVGRVLKRVAGRVPVVVGVSAPGFASMRALARGAMDAGAAGVMIAPAPGLRGDDGVMAYLAGASEAVGDAPWVLQDFPQANAIHISADMVRRLVAADPRLVMLKAEDWPGLDKITALRRLEAEGLMRRIAMMGGNGGLFLPQEIERGTDGIMTGYAVPEMLVRVCDHIWMRPYLEGREGGGARPVRPAPAADPLREPARAWAGGAEIRAGTARHHRLRRGACTGAQADPGDAGGGGLDAGAAGGARCGGACLTIPAGAARCRAAG